MLAKSYYRPYIARHSYKCHISCVGPVKLRVVENRRCADGTQHSFPYSYPPPHNNRAARRVTHSTGSSTGPPSDGSEALNPLTRVVLPTALALMICNMDRICLSVAIIPMSAEFGWPARLQGAIQSSFLWGYITTQLLGGALADKHGGKRVLAVGLLWFSVATMLLPAALSKNIVAAGLTVPAVMAVRCAVGVGEGVALPSMSSLVSNFVPMESKAKGLGLCFTGFNTGNLLGLIISPIILVKFGWRALFYIFGLLGFPVLAIWQAVLPNTQPGSATSTTSHQPSRPTASVWTLLSKPATWAIIIVNIVNHFGYFIYLTWMPTYFVKALGFDLRSSSMLSVLPWLVMALGSSLSGVLADSLVARKVNVTTVRKAVQAVAFLVPATALVALSQPNLPPQAAVALMTAALGFTSLGQAGYVANMSDIAPRHSGQMFGLCNTFGSLAGIAGVNAVGYIVEATQSFNAVFQLTAGLYVLGTAVYLMLATGERVFD